MQGDFELNKLGWYTVQNVAQNDFLNQKLTSDQYGLYYSVQFEGDAETYLWQTKTEPEKGKRYWGHLEKTASGKSVRFKPNRDVPPATDGKPSPQQIAQESHGDAITASMCVKLAFSQFCHVETMLPNSEEHWQMIEYMADMLYKTIKKTGSQTKEVQKIFPGAEPLPNPPEDI